MNLANLFGKNKISMEERAEWVESQREMILKAKRRLGGSVGQVAQEPLKEEHREWWCSASDGCLLGLGA